MNANVSNVRGGQAMIIAVLSMGGAMLGVTTIAGILILFQIRQTTDAVNSAKAIFAADAGVEYALFDYFCPFSLPARCSPPPEPAPSAFSNGVTVAVKCYNATNGVTTCGNASAATAISKGTSATSHRAFFLDLTFATSSLP